jgi:hypothetical protein
MSHEINDSNLALYIVAESMVEEALRKLNTASEIFNTVGSVSDSVYADNAFKATKEALEGIQRTQITAETGKP